MHAEHGNMPHWAQENPQALWQAAEISERANGRLSRESEVAIPRELPDDLRLNQVRAFVHVAIGGAAKDTTWYAQST